MWISGARAASLWMSGISAGLERGGIFIPLSHSFHERMGGDLFNLLLDTAGGHKRELWICLSSGEECLCLWECFMPVSAHVLEKCVKCDAEKYYGGTMVHLWYQMVTP